MENKLSHVNEQGKANMVDVSEKTVQKRTARASGRIVLSPQALQQVRENLNKKGDVLAVAEIAGVQAAKQTATLIPLCHNLQITKASVKCEIFETGIEVRSEVICLGRTGVEMEALTAVSVALLTVYDMCKAVDKNMCIEMIKLDEKLKENL